MELTLPPQDYVIRGLLPMGIGILGGASKIGKSWLMRDLCTRVAKGEPLWDMETRKQELESISARIAEMDLREQYVREFMENARVYIEMPKLTPELLRVFIRCIEVYEKEAKYSRTCGNTILVHFTFEMPKQKTVAAAMAATAMTADRNVA